jgi:hypothetical protein
MLPASWFDRAHHEAFETLAPTRVRDTSGIRTTAAPAPQ